MVWIRHSKHLLTFMIREKKITSIQILMNDSFFRRFFITCFDGLIEITVQPIENSSHKLRLHTCINMMKSLSMIFYGKNALPLHIINIIERKKQRAKSDQIQLKSVLLHKINISGDGLHSKLSTTSKQLKEDVNEKGISHFAVHFTKMKTTSTSR